MSGQEKIKLSSVRWSVGAHMPCRGSVSESMLMALEFGMYSIQVFLGNPKSLTRSNVSEKEVEAVNAIQKRFAMHIFSHFPYTASLNGSAASLAWNGDKQQDAKTRYMMEQLQKELTAVARLSENHPVRSGVVIHPGSYKDRAAGLKTIAETINRMNFSEGALLLLENCAGEGNKLCRDFQEIATILEQVDEKQKKHIGVCVDTAHIWGQGDYNISTLEGVLKLFEDFDRLLGPDRFTLLHLNDSRCHLGAKKDQHAYIATGHIWQHDVTSLLYLLEECERRGIPMILETCAEDMHTLACL